MLEVRGRWERIALALFTATFTEEEEAVRMFGRSGISTDRWLSALLTVWEGAGNEWGEIVEASLEEGKGRTGHDLKEMRDNSATWRRLVEFGIIKSEAIVETTREAFALIGLDAYNAAEVRAETMAATEAVQSMNYAQIEKVKARAPLLLKIWQSIIDDRTRPSHLDANGQVRKLNDPYSVGGEALQWPADAGGALREVINCRCWEDYEVPAERRG